MKINKVFLIMFTIAILFLVTSCVQRPPQLPRDLIGDASDFDELSLLGMAYSFEPSETFTLTISEGLQDFEYDGLTHEIRIINITSYPAVILEINGFEMMPLREDLDSSASIIGTNHMIVIDVINPSDIEFHFERVVECYNDSDCGDATSTLYCVGDVLHENISSPSCTNAGTSTAECVVSFSHSSVLCPGGCEHGACVNETTNSSMVRASQEEYTIETYLIGSSEIEIEVDAIGSNGINEKVILIVNDVMLPAMVVDDYYIVDGYKIKIVDIFENEGSEVGEVDMVTFEISESSEPDSVFEAFYTLEEDSTGTFTYLGSDHDIELDLVADNEDGDYKAMFFVNPEIVDYKLPIKEGQSRNFDNISIYVEAILGNEASESIGEDVVQFRIDSSSGTDSSFDYYIEERGIGFIGDVEIRPVLISDNSNNVLLNFNELSGSPVVYNLDEGETVNIEYEGTMSTTYYEIEIVELLMNEGAEDLEDRALINVREVSNSSSFDIEQPIDNSFEEGSSSNISSENVEAFGLFDNSEESIVDIDGVKQIVTDQICLVDGKLEVIQNFNEGSELFIDSLAYRIDETTTCEPNLITGILQEEYTTETYTIDGIDYEVEIVVSTSTGARLMVNGETTGTLSEGESDFVAGTEVRVINIFNQEGSEARSDFVEFEFVGAPSSNCTDSDGSDIGAVHGEVYFEGIVYEDVCTSSTTFREYSCDGDELAIHELGCAPGEICLNGACRNGTTKTYHIDAGWNLVSLPMETEFNTFEDVFFDYPVSAYWGINGFDYERKLDTDVMEIGEGYWIRATESFDWEINGIPIDRLELTLEYGWNFLGSVITDSTLPEEIIAYGYNPLTGSYFVSSTVESARGYIVPIRNETTIVLN